MKLAAIIAMASFLAAAPCAASDPQATNVWFNLQNGQTGYYTKNFSQPWPIDPNRWFRVVLGPGDSIVVHIDCPPCAADIDGDGKVGLAEAIHALQTVAGMRPAETEEP